MNRNKLAVIVSLTIPFIFGGCSKYDDGCASFISKEKRLCHNWVVGSFESENDPNRHSMWLDIEHFNGDDTGVIPYDIWYPSSGTGGWVSIGGSPSYFGCYNPLNFLGIDVDSLKFQITNLKFQFKEDNTFYISYTYDNKEFDREATDVNCDQAVYKYTIGFEEVTGKWKFSKNKKELKISLDNPALHFPLLDHCLRSRVYINQLCKDKVKLSFGYTYLKNPNGWFLEGPYGFFMTLKLPE